MKHKKGKIHTKAELLQEGTLPGSGLVRLVAVGLGLGRRATAQRPDAERPDQASRELPALGQLLR